MRLLKKILLFLIMSAPIFSVPQAVVFDFGGVMVGKTDRESIICFLQDSLQLSNEEFEKGNLEKRQAAKSGMTDEQFWATFAKRKGIVLPPNWSKQFTSVMEAAIKKNSDMYALVDALQKEHVRVALLSNVDERLSKIVREMGLYEPFDPCLLSCEIGAEKPDPNAYNILLKRMNLPAADIVFIDDNQENVNAAKKLGFDAVLFTSEEQIRQELKKRFFLQG